MLLYKNLAYKKIHRKRTYEVFTCQICNKMKGEETYYRSNNLCYICKECGDKMVRDLVRWKTKKWKYREMKK